MPGPRTSIGASASLAGEIRPPGDKSISHRALLLSALAVGSSTIDGLSGGADVGRTATIVGQLGASLKISSHGLVEIEGGGLRSSSRELDCGNSGTTMRLVMGVLAGIDGRHQLVGDASLSRRPMDRVAEPLELMGAQVEGRGPTCTAPLILNGGPLRSIVYDVPVPSAQVKSAILFAALSADGPSTLRESVRTRRHTEEMMLEAGVELRVVDESDSSVVTLIPGPVNPRRWVIPADPSQAAFFAVAGALSETGPVVLEGLYAGPARSGFLAVLSRMGAIVESRPDVDARLDVTVWPAPLHATDVESEEIPSLDEVPVLAIAAAAATGITRFSDVAELRIKESDRLSKTIELAVGLGARAWSEDDNLFIEGLGSARHFSHLDIDAEGDHRIAMAAAIGGAVGCGATIDGFDSILTSYPAFLDDLDSLR